MKGLNEAFKRIDRKTEQIHKDAKEATKKTGLKIEGGAKRLSAVDTGENRQKIETVITNGGATAHVYARAEHARKLEEGSSSQKPQPFLMPAYRQEIRLYKKELEKIIAKEVK